MGNSEDGPEGNTPQASLPDARTWELQALTDIWTGDARPDRKRLILTGIMGSLRWWFEVLVRGLGGTACDPSATECQVKNHCPVCELFGCAGWARKFRFQVLDAQGKTMSSAIAKDAQFQLRFVPLRLIRKEEWTLLHLTSCLIADYGAIGGRTVFKPSDENSRANAQHHRDYGLVKLVREAPTVEQIDRKGLEEYLGSRWRKVDHDDFAWASLQNFWCVKGKYLTRTGPTSSAFNKLVGRDERKTCRDCGAVHNPPQRCPKTRRAPYRFSEQMVDNSARAKWLAGDRGESKKVFSFKEPADASRTFGFVKPGTVSFDQMKQRLKQAWPDLKDTDFRTGEAILEALFKRETGDSR